MAGQTINVSILADTRKFSSAMRNLSRETGLTKLGDGFKKLGGQIAGAFKTGVKATTAMAAAIAGLALKGGFERAMKIEDAEAKLKGLGHSATAIDTIMDSALASVKGTAAGLDEAATMAANAVAAGIQPGEDLTAALSLVNDAATIAGTSMGEMGSIFSKVWTSGRAQTQELNQIADRGIPIWTALAEHYGVSADELRKMVSAGQVDAATFETVMRDQLGGAALAAGDTTRGAFANMRAALSRVGESFLKEIFPMFRESFLGITGGLDKLAPYAEQVGAAFAQWLQDTAIPAVQRLAGWVRDTLIPAVQTFAAFVQSTIIPALRDFGDYVQNTIVPALRDFADWLDRNKEKIAAAAVVIGAFIAALQAFNQVTVIIRAAAAAFAALNAAMLANPIGLVVAAIAALVAGLVLFFTQTETGREIWDRVWTFIKNTAQVVADWFTGTVVPALQSAWDAIKVAAELAANWYNEHVAPLFQAAGELIGEVAHQLHQIWEQVWGQIKAVWDVIGGPVMLAIETAIIALQGVWDVVWNAIKAVLIGVWNAIKGTIETVLAVISGIISGVTAAIRGDWSGVWNAIKNIASAVWDGIKGAVSNAINTVSRIISGTMNSIRNAWSRAWDNVKNKVSDSWDSLKSTVNQKGQDLLGWFKGLPGRITSSLGDLSSTLKNAGRQLIDGFVNSITGGFQSVRNKLTDLTNLIPNWKGPASKDRTILKNAGSLVIEGFIDGLESQYGNVKRSLLGLTTDVAATRFDPPVAPDIPTTRHNGHHNTASSGLDRGIQVEELAAAIDRAAARHLNRATVVLSTGEVVGVVRTELGLDHLDVRVHAQGRRGAWA